MTRSHLLKNEGSLGQIRGHKPAPSPGDRDAALSSERPHMQSLEHSLPSLFSDLRTLGPEPSPGLVPLLAPPPTPPPLPI